MTVADLRIDFRGFYAAAAIDGDKDDDDSSDNEWLENTTHMSRDMTKPTK